MREYSFFSAILGLSSEWRIAHVAIDEQTGITEIHIQNQGSGEHHCTACGVSPVTVRSRKTRWLHENRLNFTFLISALIPVLDCVQCGAIKELIPWINSGNSFRELESDELHV